MMQGLKNAVAQSSRVGQHLFGNLPGTAIFNDDLLIGGIDYEDCYENTCEVLKIVEKHKIALKLSKCELFIEKVSFLGHVIENGCFKPDPDRYQGIIDLPSPRSISELRRFLGFMNWYRNYISEFADKARPLYQMVVENSLDSWNSSHDKLVANFKEELRSSLLSIPDPDKPLKLETDASDNAISAVISQSGKPVCFASRVLRDHERNYPIFEKEALAVIFATQKFRKFLLGKKFILKVDNKALSFILDNPKQSSKSIRSRMNLEEFDFDVQFKKGSENVAADTLSRCFYADDDELPLWKVDLLKTAHGAHRGKKAMISYLIEKKITWKGLHADIRQFLHNCDTCSRVKPH